MSRARCGRHAKVTPRVVSRRRGAEWRTGNGGRGRKPSPAPFPSPMRRFGLLRALERDRHGATAAARPARTGTARAGTAAPGATGRRRHRQLQLVAAQLAGVIPRDGLAAAAGDRPAEGDRLASTILASEIGVACSPCVTFRSTPSRQVSAPGSPPAVPHVPASRPSTCRRSRPGRTPAPTRPRQRPAPTTPSSCHPPSYMTGGGPFAPRRPSPTCPRSSDEDLRWTLYTPFGPPWRARATGPTGTNHPVAGIRLNNCSDCELGVLSLLALG